MELISTLNSIWKHLKHFLIRLAVAVEQGDLFNGESKEANFHSNQIKAKSREEGSFKVH